MSRYIKQCTGPLSSLRSLDVWMLMPVYITVLLPASHL